VLFLNPTGHAIVNLCCGNLTLSDIVQTLASRYHAPAEKLAQEVGEYLARLRAKNLLVMSDHTQHA
jgi:hypothetical protein